MAYNKKKKMMEQVHTIVDRLSEVIGNMQKCLECTICLHTITDPVKTLCGHRFCRLCIQRVLQNKNAHCPLCNTAIHRRSITGDEHMVLYIDRLEKLIQSIQMDSGIDILSHLPRPRDTLETRPSDDTEHRETDDAEQIKPSCSYNASPPRKQSFTHSNRSPQRQRRVYKGRKAKHKNVEKDGASITKYLSKCVISGVEPLAPDESNDPLNAKSMEQKVNSWLENLPETDKFDDPNRTSPVQLRECNLDDTLITSISLNCPGNKPEATAKVAEVAAAEESNSRSSCMTKRYSRSSLRDERKEDAFDGKEEGRGDCRAGTVERNETRTELDTLDPKPSTSGRTKPSVDRERSQDRYNDVRRTSPGDLLPAMKKNWSSVKEFGREMRTRRKKLKSLNVSIENKGRSRSLDEPEASIHREEIIETDGTKGPNNRRRRKGTRMPENVTKPLLDKEFVVGETCTAGNEDALEGNASPRSRCDRSSSGGVRIPGESSFITFEGGERACIRDLNSTRMNEIIGAVEHNNEPVDVEMVAENSPKRKDDDPSSTRPGDQLKIPPYATPAKSPVLPGRRNVHTESNQKQTDLSPPDTVLQGFTPPNRGRLSLKKRSVDQKTNDSFGMNAESRLQAVRRNLNPGLDHTVENVDERATNAEEKGATDTSKELGRNLGTDGENIRRVKDLPDPSNELSDAKKERNGHNRPLVAFKKLGKIYKHRKKRVTFSYLGRTSCEFFHCCPSMSKQKPCNPIDTLDTQDMNGGFGSNAQIAANDTPAARELENRNTEASGELEKGLSEIRLSPNHDQEIIAHSISKTLTKTDNKNPVQSQESDVLLVTLDENEQIFNLPVARTTESSVKTSTNAAVKMLSPAKDSQLQFLSLESPVIGDIGSQEVIGRSEHVKDNSVTEYGAWSSGVASRASPRASCGSESPCAPQRKRRRSRSRENLLHRMIKHGDDTADDFPSHHSFSSQVTCLRNSSKLFPPFPTETTSERCRSSSTKNVDSVSLSSDTDTLSVGESGQKKVSRRIVPLASSASSSPDLISLNDTPGDRRVASPTTKRKRDASPDSDGEADLNVIVSNWYEQAKPGDRYKKRGKLEGTRDPLNSMNASREARNNSSTGSCASDRNRGANKLSERQNRRTVGFGQNTAPRKSNFAEMEGWRRAEERTELVVLEDSPDFGATIDKMKDIRGRGFFDGKQDEPGADNLLQDNFDEIIANVVTDSLIDNCYDGKELNAGKEPDEFLEGYQSGENTRKLKNDFVCPSSDASDKENAYTNLAPQYDANDDTDKTLTPEHKGLSNKNSRIDKFERKPTAVQLPSNVESMSIESNKSMVRNPAAPFDQNKRTINENVENDSMVKDTCEQDSLMNITQQYLMIKQFEEDLFGKPKSSNAVSEKEQTKHGPQTPQKKKKEGLKKNAKDVEHSGEEDDIVENTPDTKTKTRSIQAVDSPRESSRVSSHSQMFAKQFPDDSPTSTCRISSAGVNTPACKRRIHPLYQSTPKTELPVSNNNYSAAKTISTINESFVVETRPAARRSHVETVPSAQSGQNNAAQRFCFVCSGLLPAQIELVKKLATMVNGRYVTQFDRDVTHVIVKANKENNGASKTLKYLQGVAHRKWIVGYQWVVGSLKARSLINEEPYEAVDSMTLEAGPRKSRLREKNLFEGFVFLCIGPYDDVSDEQYHDLLRATGAIVVDSLDALAAEKKRLKIIVIQADIYNYEIIEWYKKARAIPIVHDWVIECISQHKLISFYPYLQELSRQDVLALGYPEYLVEEEADGDSDSMCDESS